MKKNFLLFAGVMTALASCSTEDIVESKINDNEIAFNASVGFTSAARGIESSNNALKDFYVSAMIPAQNKVFMENVLYYKEGGKYVTKNPYHWSHELVLDLYAYGYCTKATEGSNNSLPENIHDSQLAGEVTFTPDQFTINDFSPANEIANQIDFIFTEQLGVTQPGMGNPVTLNFAHMLSEVGVDAICKSKTHQVKVAGIKYGNIISKGNFSMKKESDSYWTLANEKTTYSEIRLPQPVLLGETPKNISMAEEVGNPIGFAILLPQGFSTFSKNNEYFGGGVDGLPPVNSQGDTKTLTSAQYLAVLCRIELLDQTSGSPTEAIKFPVLEDYMVETIDGEVYGWAYIPFHMGDKYSAWEMGKRYRYHLDFTNGAGYNDDGNNIIMGDVSFNVDVATWTNVDIYYPVQPTPSN